LFEKERQAVCAVITTRYRKHRSFRIPMVSILILTRNEESNLPGCLQSVNWSDDIHVFDSYSTDRTVELAREAGARITQRQFDNWSEHQNWGLQNIPFRYPWVFYIDADERVTVELKSNIQKAVETPQANVAFLVQRRDFLFAQWLKHSQATAMYTRLFRPENMRYERLVNPISIADGPVGRIAGYLDHFPFSKGITAWLDRHNSYSSLEAQEIVARRSEAASFSITKLVLARSFSERRCQQKELFYRMPCRPLIKFLLLYIVKRGFLDGYAGFTYAALQSIYEYMIVLKTREISVLTAGPPVSDFRANDTLHEAFRLSRRVPD
jgi:glycosyltransferase involved in cell wall biosynthesis